ncbi:helix-turn-helix domain-containing protein [Paracoccus aminophilus]|uniref:Transcriptional regulator, XRE family n=1 Tax=Paracoccus aminophilus JCM 7686 TaxID=1367847 RepID=S5XQF9_PARAH|nr:XRE family transcriptional regulator [Paracoccus aminophilus]AGT07292.1 transcriptional regulator, XRE family [Paracoccus aminophilus JCM 7686]
MSKQIGDDIRALRRGRGITLKELAGAVGRSLGWLSQIERGQTAPSVRDLGAIADFFGINISFFFRSASRAEEEQGLILRAADRMAIGSHESGLTEELLSPSLSGSFEMIKSVFAPHSTSGGEVKAREKEDGGILVSGRLSLRIGELSVDLEPGDSFQFINRAYSWENHGEEPAVVIWVVSPPVY